MQSSSGTLVAGVIFGSALTLSGVASPQVIRDQFRCTDFHMLLTFLTASASSAATIAVHNSRNIKALPVKTHSTYGWLGKYDGNIIGGSMVGLGMAITGACPGTVLVQAAVGIGRSRLLATSSLLAGFAFVRWKVSLKRPLTTAKGVDTIMEATGLSSSKVVFAYEALMVVTIISGLAFAPRSHAILHPIVGGLLIGFGQISSVLLTRKVVGVSSAYEDAGKFVWNLVYGEWSTFPESIVFAAGLIAGAKLTTIVVPATLEALSGSPEPSLQSIVVGGFLLSFGARMAAGCTSGHGISGMAAMGIASIITVASMFGTGLIAGLLTA